MTEAKLLARVQHRNVVNLLGYCVHGSEKLLVYEYVMNESLDKLLFSKYCLEILFRQFYFFLPLKIELIYSVIERNFWTSSFSYCLFIQI